MTANVVPLVLLCVGLSGHGVRERAPTYLFGAGLVALLAVTGGYSLSVVLSGQDFGETQVVRVFQLGGLTMALWALLWLASRPFLGVWREGEASPLARPLMRVQLALAAAWYALLLLVALPSLIALLPGQTPSAWTIEAGSGLGWLLFAAVIAGPILRAVEQRSRLYWPQVGLTLLAAVGMTACTVEAHGGGGFRVLMLGCAGLALLWSLGSFVEKLPMPGRLFTSFPDSSTAAVWVLLGAALALGLALKSAFLHDDRLWASVALLLASLGGAGMALWQRREDWAFGSGLGVNLAASLLVWHFGDGLALGPRWVLIIQINVIASALVALLWQLNRGRLEVQWRLPGIESPLLCVQSLLGLAGQLLLLLGPLVYLVIEPERRLPADLAMVPLPAGWLAWGASLAAALLWCRRWQPRRAWDIFGLAGMMLGILIASLVKQDQEVHWLAYHTLTLSWGVLGIVAAGLLARLSVRALASWVEVLAAALVLLGLRGLGEATLRPWTTAGPALLGSMLMGVVAVRLRLPLRVYCSGLFLVIAGWLLWEVDPRRMGSGLALALVLSLAVGSFLWTVIELALRKRTPPIDLRGANAAFAHLAIVVALVGLMAVCVVGPASYLLAWVTWGVVGLALAVLLWDEQARFSPAALYALGLAGIVLLLRDLNLEPSDAVAVGSLLLTGLLLLSTAICRLVPRLAPACDRLGLALWVSQGPVRGWFVATQTTLAAVVVALGLSLSLLAETPLDRLAGAASTALLLATGVSLAAVLTGKRQEFTRIGSLLLGPLVLVEAGWVLLDPVWQAGVLHHSAVLVIALVLGCVLYRDGLRALRGPDDVWSVLGRGLSVVLGTLGGLAFVAMLGLEIKLYDKVLRRSPLTTTEMILAALAGVGLIVLALRAALAKPASEEERANLKARTRFVYGSEVLLLLLFIHLRLNAPFFQSNKALAEATGAKGWPILVMVLAFLGAGLAELFRRRGLEVLAVPLHRTGLFLPLLPLLAFWLKPGPEVVEFAGDMAPGMKVILAPLINLPDSGGMARLWFLMSLLLLGMALVRRSFTYSLAAALAANVGLWMLLTHHGLAFFLHPQLWLVPLALVILASEQINRGQLTREQRLGLRYLGLVLLYVSSTADMFINGVGTSVVLPLVLAVLAVLGILAGILLRVRAFLFVGLLFLVVDVLSMIWHAAVDQTQTWVWYASGIVLGGAIIALFAVFEKRRPEILQLIEEIKRWD